MKHKFFSIPMPPFSYACRPEKGVHKAVAQVQKNLQRFSYYVKIDIAGYFAAINHDVLLVALSKRYKGNAFLQQLERIVSSHHATEKVGLPIGSLTSQYFANYYLDALDRKLETDANIHAYVRYMDDIIWWCSDKVVARQSLKEINSWLWQQRKLTVKPSCQVQSSKRGVTYCGFRVSQGAVRLTTRKKQRFQARRQYWESLYQQGKIDALQLQRAYASVHAITVKDQSLIPFYSLRINKKQGRSRVSSAYERSWDDRLWNQPCKH